MLLTVAIASIAVSSAPLLFGRLVRAAAMLSVAVTASGFAAAIFAGASVFTVAGRFRTASASFGTSVTVAATVRRLAVTSVRRALGTLVLARFGAGTGAVLAAILAAVFAAVISAVSNLAVTATVLGALGCFATAFRTSLMLPSAVAFRALAAPLECDLAVSPTLGSTAVVTRLLAFVSAVTTMSFVASTLERGSVVAAFAATMVLAVTAAFASGMVLAVSTAVAGGTGMVLTMAVASAAGVVLAVAAAFASGVVLAVAAAVAGATGMVLTVSATFTAGMMLAMSAAFASGVVLTASAAVARGTGMMLAMSAAFASGVVLAVSAAVAGGTGMMLAVSAAFASGVVLAAAVAGGAGMVLAVTAAFASGLVLAAAVAGGAGVVLAVPLASTASVMLAGTVAGTAGFAVALVPFTAALVAGGGAMDLLAMSAGFAAASVLPRVVATALGMRVGRALAVERRALGVALGFAVVGGCAIAGTAVMSLAAAEELAVRAASGRGAVNLRLTTALGPAVTARGLGVLALLLGATIPIFGFGVLALLLGAAVPVFGFGVLTLLLGPRCEAGALLAVAVFSRLAFTVFFFAFVAGLWRTARVIAALFGVGPSCGCGSPEAS